MNGTRTRNGMGWSTRLLVGLVLMLAGAAAAVWGLAHYQPAARFLGIAPAARQAGGVEALTSEYEGLGAELRRGGPQDSWWTNFKRELGSVVEIHRAERPAVNPEARYNRALQRLSSGDVDQALAETMRLPGAGNAADWVGKARRYVAAHRALDEVESAALLTGPPA